MNSLTSVFGVFVLAAASLVFIHGSDSSGPSSQMQADMDFLCTNDTYNLNLNITNYQLNWHTNYP